MRAAIEEIDELQAELDRLKSAGDLLASAVIIMGIPWEEDAVSIRPALAGWIATRTRLQGDSDA